MNKNRVGIIAGVLVLVGLVGVGIWQGLKVRSAAAALVATGTAEASGAYQTSTVRKGDISLDISGSGTVITNQSVDLAFATAGTVGELDVQVGDTVTSGQVLARLKDTSALEQAVKNQELAVQAAQQKLDDLLSNGSETLAQAYVDEASAEAAYAAAKAGLHQKGDARCLPSKTQEYYFKYLYAQQRVSEWEGYLDDPNTGYGRDYILEQLRPMRKERDQALANMNYCQGYTDQEINASQASYQVAQAKYELASQQYQALSASAGIDATAVATAKATLENAKLQLTKAQANLAGAVITAPVDGTVMAVNGSLDQPTGTGAFITIADLEHPQVQVSIDETDLVNFAVGCAADVSFTSLPGQTFKGVVTDVTPSLVTVQSVAVVQGLVDLENPRTSSGKVLPIGLSASVEITCQQAGSVLLVPAMAVYKDGQGSYVYVLDAQGKPKKRAVALGIETVASAEVKSGLSEGEKVIISQVKAP